LRAFNRCETTQLEFASNERGTERTVPLGADSSEKIGPASAPVATANTHASAGLAPLIERPPTEDGRTEELNSTEDLKSLFNNFIEILRGLQGRGLTVVQLLKNRKLKIQIGQRKNVYPYPIFKKNHPADIQVRNPRSSQVSVRKNPIQTTEKQRLLNQQCGVSKMIKNTPSRPKAL
jgi:hypothetical protein